jgi:hypothetical protein
MFLIDRARPRSAAKMTAVHKRVKQFFSSNPPHYDFKNKLTLVTKCTLKK